MSCAYGVVLLLGRGGSGCARIYSSAASDVFKSQVGKRDCCSVSSDCIVVGRFFDCYIADSGSGSLIGNSLLDSFLFSSVVAFRGRD